MSYFDDFKTGLDDYRVEIEIDVVNVDFEGEVLDVNEICPFQVRVTNNGHLNMTDVTLEVEGQNGTLVGVSETGPWEKSIQTGPLTVNGGGGTADSTVLYFKAPGEEKASGYTTLISAHIKRWNANLNRLLNTETREIGDRFGHYNSAVSAA